MKTNIIVISALCILLLLNVLFLKWLGTPFDTAFWSSIGMGLLPNIAGLIIAVFAVDAIIRFGRRSFFSKRNHKHSQSVAYAINKLLLNILQELNLVEDESACIESIKKGERLKIAEKILADIGFNFVIKDMRNYLVNGTFGKAVLCLAESENYLVDTEKLSAAISKGIEDINEYLNQIKPYTSQGVQKIFEEELKEVMAIIIVAQKMEKELLNHESFTWSKEQHHAIRAVCLVELGNKLQHACLNLTYLSEEARKNKIFDVID